MRSCLVLSLMLALAAPAIARGQTLSAAPLEDRPAVKINEVERGFSLGTEAGGLLLFKPSATSGSGASLGRAFGLSMGIDITDRVGLSLMALGGMVATPSDFVSPSGMTGSFSTFVFGGQLRFAPVVAADSYGVNRFYWWVHAGGGAALMSPKNFYSKSDVLLLAGTGIEYFTHLRHFSLGLDADVVYGAKNIGAGVKLAPYLRYTF